MGAVLHAISKVAPFVFYSSILLLVVSKIFTQISRTFLYKYNRQRIELEQEMQRLRRENHAFVDKLNDDTTSNTTDGSCPVTGGECQFAELELRRKRIERNVSRLGTSLTILHAILASPLGQLLCFLGNADSFKSRRQL